MMMHLSAVFAACYDYLLTRNSVECGGRKAVELQR